MHSSSIWAFAHTRVFSSTVGLADALAASAAFRRSLGLAEKVCVWCCLALFCLLVMVPKERGRDFAAGCGVCVYGSLAKGGLNGRHRPPLPCDLPMGGFPYEFGPETGR